jgi:hypothetical protein
MRLYPGLVDLEERGDVFLLKITAAVRVKISDRQQGIVVEDLPAYTELLGYQSDRGDSAAFPIAAVAHLSQGLQQVPGRDLLAAGDADNAAAALCSVLTTQEWRETFCIEAGSGGDDFQSKVA